MTTCFPQARDDCQAAADAFEAHSENALAADAIAPADSELDRWSVEVVLQTRPGPLEADLQCAYALRIDDVTRDAAAVHVRYVR